ncbi:MAG: DUF6295 family protein [Chloroflexi bacterium]|nr:DUF6295 family protein [Chloroflexota bacterium]MDA1228796.1 DUF6295 family protein [Chloroflexota bacterium]
MCNYVTEKTKISGSGKSSQGWIPLTEARVYFDHPFHTMEDHTLNIDFVDENQGINARVAVELTAESARALIVKIEAALKFGEEAHLTA